MSDFIQALLGNDSNPIAVTGTNVKPFKRALDTYDVLVYEIIESLQIDLNTTNTEIIAILESIDQNTANTTGQLLAVNDELNTQTTQLGLIREATQSIDADIDVPLSTIASLAEQQTQTTVLNDILAALSGGGNLITQTIFADYTVTDEDFILVAGASPVTITMPASGTKKVIIKSICEATVTIAPPSGNINGVANLQLPGVLSGGLAEGNLGVSITLIPEGGQFWLV